MVTNIKRFIDLVLSLICSIYKYMEACYNKFNKIRLARAKREIHIIFTEVKVCGTYNQLF
jgi:hypothetical protein